MKNKFILLLIIPILVFACAEEGNNVDKKKEQLKSLKVMSCSMDFRVNDFLHAQNLLITEGSLPIIESTLLKK